MPDPQVPVPSASGSPANANPSQTAERTTPVGGQRVLQTLLDRLFASLVNGPGLNCRPHRSRQRIDWSTLSALQDLAPSEALRELLGEDRATTLRARAAAPKGREPARRGKARRPAAAIVPPAETPLTDQPVEEALSPAQGQPAHSAADSPQNQAWDAQTALLQKLNIIANDARTYEQDTGVHALYVGFPLLSLPPGFAGGNARSQGRRVLAPIAFVPISLTLRRGATRAIEISCRGEGVDLVQPNTALLAWLQRQTGHGVESMAELFADERGEDPWREVAELVRQVCRMVDLPVPESFAAAAPPERLPLPEPEEPAENPPASVTDMPAAVAPSPGRVELPSDEDLLADELSPPGQAPVVAEPAESGGNGEQPAAEAEPDEDAETAEADADADEPESTPEDRPLSARALDVTLELSAAPRTEDADAAAIVHAAVLGLFPTMNQGLLRDMQEMAEQPATLTGPVEPFIRLASLEAPPADRMEPQQPPAATTTIAASAIPRDFSTERLVADADPCQARAVRIARQSRAMVIHGPPGTGKSQTIANIIGDHLARGQRVLFVCEKRTALDVVADRLEHMGLGGLCGVVHDPQRDQRDLYRKIREQLDQLPENTGNGRAHARLREVDEELHQLYQELTAYHAALARAEPSTGHSFHELMGQWLAASPPTVLEKQAKNELVQGVGIDSAAAAELAKVRLSELTAAEAALIETLRRGTTVRYAQNPWRHAAGVGVAALLARPVDDIAAAMERVAAAADVADQTCRLQQPLIPPFVPVLPLDTQAHARVQLTDWVRITLDRLTPDVLDRWAGRDLSAIRAARAKIAEAQPYLTAFKQQPLDAELLPRWLAAAGNDLPDVADLTQQREALQRYLDAFNTSIGWVNEICQTSPKAAWPVVARWLGENTASAAGVLRKLDAATPTATRAAGLPLDDELAAIFRRQPVDLPQLLRWQAALETYIPVAGSFLSFLHGAKKKAAAPVLEQFGLGLSGDNARRVRDFVVALRARLETREALLEACGPEALGGGMPPALPDDNALFTAFEGNRSVLRAAIDLHRGDDAAVARAADATALVNRMVAAEHDAARPLFDLFALPATPQNAARLTALLNALTIRVILQALNEGPLDAPTPDGLMDDHDLEVSIGGHAALFDLALQTTAEPALKDIWPALAAALAQRETLVPLLDALRLSPRRATDLLAYQAALSAAGLFHPAWVERANTAMRAGEPMSPDAQRLRDALPTLEDVVRVHDAVARLSPTLRPAVTQLLAQSAQPQAAWDVLRRGVLASEITRRLAADPILQGVDGHKLSHTFDRYRELDQKKKQHVRDDVLHMWLHRQRERLLAASGTKLSSAGAELRRRLLLRGERAMRLRQVVARGQSIAGGDPLFDVCPIWMVSPETAAQVFPRQPIFDVVIFDEASQCRLEEALPVLTRGRRVVIAGDPKQLPPTRFFETTFAASDDTEEPEDDQGWFEQQQGEVEDLLSAALGLDADQCYLDVHYRSRNAALIEFSNQHFYGRRLQPIPGHPARRAKLPPIRLIRADGVYEKRRNVAEADAVVALVRELLFEKKPPSIGIACFNLVQRELILEKLDELAEEDAKFARKLAEARERVGSGTFEGLFVKNLENVQGDERDHIIISTTYGPDAAGRFYRRVGPLAMPGGGRRLNVLVTRARQQVHLVTSIPAEQYRSLPEPADGQTPGGGWLLFSYLNYADALAQQFAEPPEQGTTGTPAVDADALPPETDPAAKPREPVVVNPSRARSVFAEALAHKLAQKHSARSEVYWGNDGFCVDLAVQPADTPAEGAIGVLCDAARFAPADDLMEWDVFRTGVLERQGWKVHRVWTPHFFRDPAGRAQVLLSAGTT